MFGGIAAGTSVCAALLAVALYWLRRARQNAKKLSQSVGPAVSSFRSSASSLAEKASSPLKRALSRGASALLDVAQPLDGNGNPIRSFDAPDSIRDRADETSPVHNEGSWREPPSLLAMRSFHSSLASLLEAQVNLHNEAVRESGLGVGGSA